MKEKCPKCHGWGKVFIICGLCRGKGVKNDVRCGNCRASGYTRDRCYFCSSAGWIKRK